MGSTVKSAGTLWLSDFEFQDVLFGRGEAGDMLIFAQEVSQQHTIISLPSNETNDDFLYT
jgi:hypothetical protein